MPSNLEAEITLWRLGANFAMRGFPFLCFSPFCHPAFWQIFKIFISGLLLTFQPQSCRTVCAKLTDQVQVFKLAFIG